MTGMKEGAGEDPFAEDDPGSEEAGNDAGNEEAETAEATTGEARAAGVETRTTDRQGGGGRQSMQIPYKFRRDGVQDGRDRVPLFLKPDTKRAERDARRELEDRLDDEISLTDLREALVKTGLDHLDEVEGQLEEWGYGMTFD